VFTKSPETSPTKVLVAFTPYKALRVVFLELEEKSKTSITEGEKMFAASELEDISIPEILVCELPAADCTAEPVPLNLCLA
jgi:hypothetical protein